ncbi:MAG: formyltransferase family protein [Armatimonadota bacterium]|nr:formyltransferase family protein [Armatimonadota bacterium]
MPERARLTAVVLTQDEPFAVPVLLEELLGERADRIAAVFIAPPTSQRETFGELVRRWRLAFGPWTFLRYGLRYLKARLVGPRPAQVARRHGVAVDQVRDVNAPEFLERLREMGVDLVISAACPQILREELLNLPPLGCINVHSGPLPRYRGMLPTFWVLYEHEEETAVTVHFMNEKLDDGPIILQEAVPVREDETQASLMRRCKVVGGRLLSQAIDLFEMDAVETTPNPREEATHYSFPTPEQARRFRAEGGRWL